MKPSLNQILFLDIETVSQKVNFNELSDKYQTHWKKKYCTLLRRKNFGSISVEEAYLQNAAIFAEFGKIVCISTAYFNTKVNPIELRVKSYRHNNEVDLLFSFFQMIKNHFNDSRKNGFCGHNIREFDIPFIGRRALINGIPLPKILDIQTSRPWENKFIIDTLELWKFGDYKHYISLDLLTTLLDVPSPKSQMNGSMVCEQYQSGDMRSIVSYCESDVIATVNCFLKLKQIKIDGFSIEKIKPDNSESTVLEA